jgi:hypothetical protein
MEIIHFEQPVNSNINDEPNVKEKVTLDCYLIRVFQDT